MLFYRKLGQRFPAQRPENKEIQQSINVIWIQIVHIESYSFKTRRVSPIRESRGNLPRAAILQSTVMVLARRSGVLPRGPGCWQIGH